MYYHYSIDDIFDRCIPIPFSGCWIWMGACVNGYGKLDNKIKVMRVHRYVASLVSNKELSPDEVVRHTCDTPSCCNPNHLRVGTHLDNINDKLSRGRYRGRDGKLKSASDVASRNTEIKRLYLSGAKQTVLAVQFGLPQSNISRICNT